MYSFRDFNYRSTAVRFVGVLTILQFRSLFHLLYRPSYVKLPLFPIYVTDRSYISGVLHYRYFRSFTGASGGSIYHRKCLSCRYNRNCLRGCSMGERVSYIDTNERRTTHRESDSWSNYTWYLNNADSLLRKGNRPRPRESRPDIRVSDNCACVLASTRKKKQPTFAYDMHVHKALRWCSQWPNSYNLQPCRNNTLRAYAISRSLRVSLET